MKEKRMMCIFAHPQDESNIAGTIAKYAKEGWSIDLVLATKGEAHPGGKAEFEGGGVPFLRELAASAEHLGIHEVIQLTYPDGKLRGLSYGELEDKLHTLLLEKEPSIVVTFEPEGINYDPDHIKVSFAATFAFQKYAKDVKEVNGSEGKAPKLYFSCIPETTMQYLIANGVFPEESFGRMLSGVEDKKVTHLIDIRDVRMVKAEALAEYETQHDKIAPFLQFTNNPLLRYESLIFRMEGIVEAFMGKNDQVEGEL